MIPALHAIRTGAVGGPPVVLLHSAGLDLTYWDAQIRSLRRHHEVIAVDLPGHGLSPGGPREMDVTGMALAVRDTLIALDAGRAHVAGLSVGGVVAQTLAALAPQCVTSLALLDSGSRFSDAARAAMRARAATLRTEGMPAILPGLLDHWFLPQTLEERPDLVDRATKTLLHDDVASQAALWEMIADFDGRSRLAEIRVPALVLVGEHDSSSPVATSQELVTGLPSARLVVVADAAHLSPLERPDEVNEHLSAFFAAQHPIGARS